MILETTFIIDLLRGKKDAVEMANRLDKENVPLFSTSVTVFELWQGLNTEKRETEERLVDFVEKFGFLHLDVESAKQGGKIQRGLIDKGIKIDPEDCMIAGIALHHSMPIITRDAHFSRIKGIKIETY